MCTSDRGKQIITTFRCAPINETINTISNGIVSVQTSMVQRNLKHSGTNNEDAKITQMTHPCQRSTRRAANGGTCGFISRSYTYTTRFFPLKLDSKVSKEWPKLLSALEKRY